MVTRFRYNVVNRLTLLKAFTRYLIPLVPNNTKYMKMTCVQSGNVLNSLQKIKLHFRQKCCEFSLRGRNLQLLNKANFKDTRETITGWFIIYIHLYGGEGGGGCCMVESKK